MLDARASADAVSHEAELLIARRGGSLSAFAAQHLVHERPRAVGFASPCTAFGHRELLAALESYGMVRMKIVG